MFNWALIWWLTWPPGFLYAIFLMPSLCRFCWMTGGTILPWKDGGSYRHERWQRLIEDPPWVFLIYLAEFIWPSHTTSLDFHRYHIVPQTITEKPPCSTIGCNQFIQNSWTGDLHTHIQPLHENWTNDDSSEITACQKSNVACISWLCGLVREVACVSLLYLCTQVFQGIFWLMAHTQLHLLWQISGWDSRFPLHWSLKASEVSCWWPRITRTGFYNLLGFILELGDDMVHSGQIPGYFVADLHQPLPNQQFFPSENVWVPKNPVTEAYWFTLVHYSTIYSTF